MKLKFTITIDCTENNVLKVWHQKKESMSPADWQKLEEALRKVKILVREMNQEIIHKPPEESAA